MVEGGAVGEEVVDLAGLHVVGEPRDEEREHALPLRVRVRRIHVVGVHRRRGGGEAVGEAHLVAPRRRRQARLGTGWGGGRAPSCSARFAAADRDCFAFSTGPVRVSFGTATAASSTGPVVAGARVDLATRALGFGRRNSWSRAKLQLRLQPKISFCLLRECLKHGKNDLFLCFFFSRN